MNFNVSSFVQTANGKWQYRMTTACFAWYPWNEGIQRIVYPLTVNKKYNKADVERYLDDIRNTLPEGMAFDYQRTEDKSYKEYWEGKGSQLFMVDIRLSGRGSTKTYGLSLLTMLRYLREKPEIPFLYVQHKEQFPKHWGVLGRLAYLQMNYKQMGNFDRRGYEYGHALLEKKVKYFCRNWEEFELRQVFDSNLGMSRTMEGGSASSDEIKFTLEHPKGFGFSDITHDDNNPNFGKRDFPEFDIPAISYNP